MPGGSTRPRVVRRAVTARCRGRGAGVSIERDRWGIPHIVAQRRADLWLGFGYAMAQDRLFQMDYLRRKGLGRLAEVLGPGGLPTDVVARTVGLNRIAREELERLPGETRAILDAFAAGVNVLDRAVRRQPADRVRPARLPTRAVVAGRQPGHRGRVPLVPHRPIPGDRRARTGEARARRRAALSRFLARRGRRGGNRPTRSLCRPPARSTTRSRGLVGQATGDSEGTGSNNWVVAGRHCRSGRPMVASDPHIAFEAVSCWYQVHLDGDGYHVAGMVYVGMPAIMCGRNERVAWGITNNICSLRDLYQERTEPGHPGCFLFDGRWEPADETVEVIRVKEGEPVPLAIRRSRNGPIVDEILPPPGHQTGPVALKWLGADHGGWLTSLLAMGRAGSVAEFQEALRPWHVPSFNLVVADVEGHIAVQCAGRIPIREIPERGYRPGWDPDHQWLGVIPFEAMPHAVDPRRGWLASANNRLAGDDYPYPLHGTWTGGYRAVRIRQMIEAKLAEFARTRGTCPTRIRPQRLSRDATRHDVAEGRDVPTAASRRALGRDGPTGASRGDSPARLGRPGRGGLVAPLLFNAFFTHWSRAVAARGSRAAAELRARQVEGIASRLLVDDPHGWFQQGRREPLCAGLSSTRSTT